MNNLPQVIHTPNFVETAVEHILESARRNIATKGRFLLVLSGGKTPIPVNQEFAKRIDPELCSKIVFISGDERCAGPDSNDPNFGMTERSLFSLLPSKPKLILRIKSELGPELAAEEHEKALQEFKDDDCIIRADLLLLGLGDDGHTASLFPDTKALEEKDRLVVVNYIPKLDSTRVTFTYPIINAAHEVCFLVNDERKHKIVDEILGGNTIYPAGRVKAEKVTWILGSGL